MWKKYHEVIPEQLGYYHKDKVHREIFPISVFNLIEIDQPGNTGQNLE